MFYGNHQHVLNYQTFFHFLSTQLCSTETAHLPEPAARPFLSFHTTMFYGNPVFLEPYRLLLPLSTQLCSTETSAINCLFSLYTLVFPHNYVLRKHGIWNLNIRNWGSFPHNYVLRKPINFTTSALPASTIFPHNYVLRKQKQMVVGRIRIINFPHNYVLRKQEQRPILDYYCQKLSTQLCSTETNQRGLGRGRGNIFPHNYVLRKPIVVVYFQPLNPLSTQLCSTETVPVVSVPPLGSELSTQLCSTET